MLFHKKLSNAVHNYCKSYFKIKNTSNWIKKWFLPGAFKGVQTTQTYNTLKSFFSIFKEMTSITGRTGLAGKTVFQTFEQFLNFSPRPKLFLDNLLS